MGGSQSKDYWVPDEKASACTKCKKKFTFTLRRHHCRSCGGVFCSHCCFRKTAVRTRNISEEVRVCDTCYYAIVAPSASPSFQVGNSLGGTSASYSGSPPAVPGAENLGPNHPVVTSPNTYEDAFPRQQREAPPERSRADIITAEWNQQYIEMNPILTDFYFLEPEDTPADIALPPASPETQPQSPFPVSAQQPPSKEEFLAEILVLPSVSAATVVGRKDAVRVNNEVANGLEQVRLGLEGLSQSLVIGYTPTVK